MRGGRCPVELYEVMRSTFSARQFAAEPVPDAVLYTILEHARFASSGGNRQGWRVIIVRDPETKARIAELQIPAARQYTAQVAIGESPLNTIDPTTLDDAAIQRTEPSASLIEPIAKAPVVLVVCVDLKVVASMDSKLARVGVISGASVYPFVWNILLAARNEGYGGTLTTMAVTAEPRLQRLLGIPAHVAVAALIPFGRPLERRTKLTRKPVSAFAMHEQYDGTPLLPPA